MTEVSAQEFTSNEQYVPNFVMVKPVNTLRVFENTNGYNTFQQLRKRTKKAMVDHALHTGDLFVGYVKEKAWRTRK